MTVSTRRIGVGAGAIAMVLVLIWYAALMRPQASSLAKAHSDYNAAEQQVHELDNKVMGLKALQHRIPQDTKRLAQLSAAIPSDPDLKDVLDQLHAQATSSGVQLTSVNPGTPTKSTGTGSAAAPAGAAAGASGSAPAGALQSIQLSLLATGPYPALMNFLSSLASMDRTVVTDAVSVSQGSGGGLSASVTARIFYAPTS